MQDHRHAIPAAARRFAMNALSEPRRWPWLRCLILCPALLLASCQPGGVVDPRGPIASAEWLLIINATEIMLVVVVPVVVATLGFAWWYRSSNLRAVRNPEFTYQGNIEFVVWSIPALVVILLGGVCWIGAHQLDPRAPIPSYQRPINVDVVSLDWKWLFIYPDQAIAAVNELVVPVGIPVNFRLTSATVMNSFFVPQLGSQIYTMGGMTTHLNLMAAEPGEYPGFSANFSGDGFAEMRFMVKATSTDDFDAWVAKARASGSALDDASYAALAKPSSAVPPMTYRSVAPDFFDRIIDETTGLDPASAGVGAAFCSSPRVGG